MNNEQLFEALSGLDTAAFCDADKAIRIMSSQLRRVNPGAKLIGRAKTVRCFDDILTIIEALADAKAGDVLVIDTQGTQRAVVGELFSVEATRRGLAGIVIDGGCRDIETIRKLPTPVYATHVTPVAGTAQKCGEIGSTIVCAGVEVNDRDIVFGDEDGVIVMSESELGVLQPHAAQIKSTEQRILAEMEQGRNLMSMINLEEHLEAVKNGSYDSRLQFTVES